MCNFFFLGESIDIASYAHDVTLYICFKDIDLIFKELEVKANEISQWLNENASKANADKCHLLITTNKERDLSSVGDSQS